MRSDFDRRVVSDPLLRLIRACQARVPCHLGGGVALSGAHLAHRLSGDIDLFSHAPQGVRDLARALPDAAREAGVSASVVRDAGSLVRFSVDAGESCVALDVVHESAQDLEPPSCLEDIEVESLADLRAAKLTCILSRSEPRDLVDLLFLDRAGFPPERDLGLAIQKDGGIDPGILAWLLDQFPTRPLPIMLEPLTEDQLRAFRDDLKERLRRAALP